MTRAGGAFLALSIGFGPAAASHSSKRMADGKDWTRENLNLDIRPSYCYDDAEQNCRKYGRLYTWEFRTVCEGLTTVQ